MTTLLHPAWCNRKHQPGSNPARQEHENVWRSDSKVLPIKVSTYPCGPRNCGNEQDGGSFLSVSSKFGEVEVWLSTAEMRGLADRLNLIADVASSMPLWGPE